ncbi:MAG: Pr6Pr family membrane protein [Nocardioides sp.]|uniref:Pr6Pr family membrane protein n=1 Tax=Nocardioides sp. TaxID=35761 RepID=UPI003EFFA79E
MTGVQRAWHAATVVVVLVAVVGQLVVSARQGLSVLNFFSYFTIQSNLLVLATSVALLGGVAPGVRWLRLLRLAALTGISLTFVVFALLIGPYLSLSGLDWWLDKGLHVVVPCLAVGGLLVGPGTPWRWGDLAFIGWPMAWIVYTFARAALFDPSYGMPDGTTATVPYAFLDVASQGLGRVLVAAAVITVLLVAIASAFVGSSRRRRRSPAETSA